MAARSTVEEVEFARGIADVQKIANTPGGGAEDVKEEEEERPAKKAKKTKKGKGKKDPGECFDLDVLALMLKVFVSFCSIPLFPSRLSRSTATATG